MEWVTIWENSELRDLIMREPFNVFHHHSNEIPMPNKQDRFLCMKGGIDPISLTHSHVSASDSTRGKIERSIAACFGFTAGSNLPFSATAGRLSSNACRNSNASLGTAFRRQ
jgi:hypothetical protein